MILIALVAGLGLPLLAVVLVHVLDSFRTARWTLSVFCLAWGAFLAFPLAALINGALASIIGETAVRVFTAPLIEEALKAIILLVLLSRSQFRYFVDGAIYGFSAGIGFAMVENFAYVLAVDLEAALGVALLRALSAALLHGMTSAAVGVALGRARGALTWMPVIAGLSAAVLLHMLFNITVTLAQGSALVFAAPLIGIISMVVVLLLISGGLRAEKRRFSETLGVHNNISTGERLAVQGMGGGALEAALQNMRSTLGDDAVQDIRLLLVKQANLGILQHNIALAHVSERLQAAWRAEIDTLQSEIDSLRRRLGVTVDQYLQAVFPARDQAMWSRVQTELACLDPTRIYAFDLFMRISELAGRFNADELQALAQRLSQIDIFRHVPLYELENLSRAVETIEFVDGALLFDQGDEGDALYLIDCGRIVISTLDAAGGETPLRVYKEGDVVGDIAVLDGQPRSARARAEGSLRALVLRRDAFHLFIQSRPQVMLSILRVLAERARYTTRTVEAAVSIIGELARGEHPTVTPASAPVITTTELPVVVPIHDALARVATSLDSAADDAHV